MDLTIFQRHFTGSPTNGQFAESVHEPLLLDHGQVAFSTWTTVVVSHSSTHLLIVHFFTSICLHPAPRFGKLHRIADLENAVSFADPADDPWVVGPVVEQVPDEDVERRKRNFGCVLSRTTPFSLDSTFRPKSWQSSCKKSNIKCNK